MQSYVKFILGLKYSDNIFIFCVLINPREQLSFSPKKTFPHDNTISELVIKEHVSPKKDEFSECREGKIVELFWREEKATLH